MWMAKMLLLDVFDVVKKKQPPGAQNINVDEAQQQQHPPQVDPEVLNGDGEDAQLLNNQH